MPDVLDSVCMIFAIDTKLNISIRNKTDQEILKRTCANCVTGVMNGSMLFLLQSVKTSRQMLVLILKT